MSNIAIWPIFGQISEIKSIEPLEVRALVIVEGRAWVGLVLANANPSSNLYDAPSAYKFAEISSKNGGNSAKMVGLNMWGFSYQIFCWKNPQISQISTYSLQSEHFSKMFQKERERERQRVKNYKDSVFVHWKQASACFLLYHI